MNKKKIEKIIKLEVEKEVPNVLDNILKSCKEGKIEMKEERHFPIKSILVFASFVLIGLLLGIMVFKNKENNVLESRIIFDVNPSIELKVDDKNKITYAKALNNDGKKILNDMDLKGSNLNIGVNAIIGSMYKNGFINELKNSILVTVYNEDKNKASKLEKELTKEINDALSIYKVDASVLSQKYDVDDLIEKKSKEYGISEGKAELLEKIIAKKLTNKNGKEYTFDDLVNLNINELNVILTSKKKAVKDVNTTGTVSTKQYISETKAKEIVLNNANIKDVSKFEIELDYDYGKMIYEIEFIANEKEYEYELDATTGEILFKKVEIDDDVKKVVNSDTKKEISNNKTSNNKTNYISRTKAKEIALKNAGVSNIRDLSIELDKENGRMIYEISFESGNKEYEYEIDAITGKILKKDIEIDD